MSQYQFCIVGVQSLRYYSIVYVVGIHPRLAATSYMYSDSRAEFWCLFKDDSSFPGQRNFSLKILGVEQSSGSLLVEL